MFEKELEFFIANQDQLVDQYDGRVLVLRGDQVVGDFDDPLTAYLSASNQFEPGTFMIQPCSPGPQAYTATITTLGLVH